MKRTTHQELKSFSTFTSQKTIEPKEIWYLLMSPDSTPPSQLTKPFSL